MLHRADFVALLCALCIVNAVATTPQLLPQQHTERTLPLIQWQLFSSSGCSGTPTHQFSLPQYACMHQFGFPAQVWCAANTQCIHLEVFTSSLKCRGSSAPYLVPNECTGPNYPSPTYAWEGCHDNSSWHFVSGCNETCGNCSADSGPIKPGLCYADPYSTNTSSASYLYHGCTPCQGVAMSLWVPSELDEALRSPMLFASLSHERRSNGKLQEQSLATQGDGEPSSCTSGLPLRETVANGGCYPWFNGVWFRAVCAT